MGEKKWFIQLICNHKWKEDYSIYYREKGGKGIVEIAYKCTRCGKSRKEIMQVK